MTSKKPNKPAHKLEQKCPMNFITCLPIENTKILIYGYIRGTYNPNVNKLHSLSEFLFTKPFNDIIFLYFYTEPRDEWDPNCISTTMEIVDHETYYSLSLDSNEKGPKVIVTAYGACSAFLTNVVHSGKHEWKFKIESTSQCWWFLIGIWKVGSSEMLLNSWFNSEMKNNSYAFAANWASLPDPSIPSDNAWGGYDSRKLYGVNCKQGDIIDMHLDFDDLTLAYSINSKYYGIAFKNIEQTKYRAVVGLCYKVDCIRLLSYKSS